MYPNQFAKPEIQLRTLAVVMLDGVDINLEQVRSGMAWVYEKYIVNSSPEIQTNYRAAQERAQSLPLGLWIDPNPIPPWEFRKAARLRQTLR